MDTLPLSIPERKTLKIHRSKSFYQKLHFHTQFGGTNVGGIREINAIHFHIRYRAFMKST
jgi:hypothetical protein